MEKKFIKVSINNILAIILSSGWATKISSDIAGAEKILVLIAGFQWILFLGLIFAIITTFFILMYAEYMEFVK